MNEVVDSVWEVVPGFGGYLLERNEEYYFTDSGSVLLYYDKQMAERFAALLNKEW